MGRSGCPAERFPRRRRPVPPAYLGWFPHIQNPNSKFQKSNNTKIQNPKNPNPDSTIHNPKSTKSKIPNPKPKFQNHKSKNPKSPKLQNQKPKKIKKKHLKNKTSNNPK